MTASPTVPEEVSPFFRDSAFEDNKQNPIHRWVPWIAGFSAGFVADTFRHYLPDPQRRDVTILEPFSGVGTTLVEGLMHGYDGIGFEVNPFAALASRVKCAAFRLEPECLRQNIIVFEHKARQRTAPLDHAFTVGDDVRSCLPAPRSVPPPGFRSRVPFFSPTVERKVLHCLDVIREMPQAELRELALLAFGAVMVRFSNYSFEPSLGSRRASRKSRTRTWSAPLPPSSTRCTRICSPTRLPCCPTGPCRRRRCWPKVRLTLRGASRQVA